MLRIFFRSKHTSLGGLVTLMHVEEMQKVLSAKPRSEFSPQNPHKLFFGKKWVTFCAYLSFVNFKSSFSSI